MPKVAAALTDYKVKTLKPKVGQTGWRDHADGACHGLLLRLSPRGEKAWAVRMAVPSASRRLHLKWALARHRQSGTAGLDHAHFDGLGFVQHDAQQVIERRGAVLRYHLAQHRQLVFGALTPRNIGYPRFSSAALPVLSIGGIGASVPRSIGLKRPRQHGHGVGSWRPGN